MAQKIEPKTSHSTHTIVHTPAQLWIGSHDSLVIQAQKALQTIFCINYTTDTQSGCGNCNACVQITNQQHHSVFWFYPEKLYTREQLNPIFRTISFALNKDQHIFFVIQKADFLTPVCANSLLKPLEEPPTGYHFLLLAQRLEQILPTIRSRCITKSFYTQTNTTSQQELFSIFTADQPNDPSDFLKILDQSKINERESVELLDILFKHWAMQYSNSIETHHIQAAQCAQNKLSAIKNAIAYPPMPGSSKLLWKNMYLLMFNN